MKKIEEIPSSKNIKINIIGKPPAIASDGSSITMFPNGQVELLFVQTQQQIGDVINVQGVSNIRLNFDQLKQFRAAIEKSIEDFEKKLGKK
jgi:hypothetical protein